MSKIFSFGFWNSIARVILRNRLLILAIIVGITIFMSTQWQHMRFSYTEANLLPDEHPVNIVYNDFLDKFGEEGNVIMLAVDDPALFTPEKFLAWDNLAKTLEKYPEVDNIISLGNLKKLEKFEDPKRFEMVPFLEEDDWTASKVDSLRDQLFTGLPFYENLIYSTHSQTVQTVIYLNEKIVNSEERKVFVLED